MGDKVDTPKYLLGMTLDQLREVAGICGLPAFSAKQMARWLYVKGATSVGEMTDLSLKARERLRAEGYLVGRVPPKAQAVSADGTVKYLFAGVGNRDIEAVYIPDGDRATLCVSSQAGCRMGCRFCMTGRQGFHGNLTSGAIVNQIFSVPQSGTLTNVVFMGMGEPLDNPDEVLSAIDIITAPWGMAWSPKRVTLSTVGVTPRLKRFLQETKVHIAVSLHFPFSRERESLMPVEKAHPIAGTLEMLRDYDFAHQRRLTMEYILFKGINDDLRHADALARLLRGTDARVNLIRYHATSATGLQPATEASMEAFRDRLNEKGIIATIRASRGEDVMAACGMLAGKRRS